MRLADHARVEPVRLVDIGDASGNGSVVGEVGPGVEASPDAGSAIGREVIGRRQLVGRAGIRKRIKRSFGGRKGRFRETVPCRMRQGGAGGKKGGDLGKGCIANGISEGEMRNSREGKKRRKEKNRSEARFW